MNVGTGKTRPIEFAGNDYLGLARDARLVKAMHNAAHEHGISCSSSRWALGWSEQLDQLEIELADYFAVEQTGLLGKGFYGGPAALSIMARHCDTVYCDEYSHTNIILGAKAADLSLQTYRHLDAEDLRRLLKAHRKRSPIIATDSVFAISGEMAPLADIVELAEQFEAELLVDEAHSVFTMGPTGKGASEQCGLLPGQFTLMGGMSKALGTDGGFLAGRGSLIEACLHTSPPSGSSSPPIPLLAASLEALKIVRDEPQRRVALHRHASQMRSILAEHELSVVSSETPIVSILLADETEARSLSDHFLTFGIRIPYFNYPAEPRKNMLRAIARSCYTGEDLSRFGEAVKYWSEQRV